MKNPLYRIRRPRRWRPRFHSECPSFGHDTFGRRRQHDRKSLRHCARDYLERRRDDGADTIEVHGPVARGIGGVARAGGRAIVGVGRVGVGTARYAAGYPFYRPWGGFRLGAGIGLGTAFFVRGVGMDGHFIPVSV